MQLFLSANVLPGGSYNLSQQVPCFLPSRWGEYTVSLLETLQSDVMHLKFLGCNRWSISASDYHFVPSIKIAAMVYIY